MIKCKPCGHICLNIIPNRIKLCVRVLKALSHGKTTIPPPYSGLFSLET